ncbi:hypothetical protein MTsPCn5_20350 [Croceitalea sp. MTPC5]|uniref:nuclear transport factor 2 family protein n=1 Tax=Croceitalea sp. MTPC5 TaxID=3056565 RepID=UPI002B3D2361|nr:hypothetical protein MTsPCn5_20350 [Croceitalea sp. MTPC5]
MKKLQLKVLGLLMVSALFVACSDDDDSTPEVVENNGQRNLETAMEFLDGFEQEDTAIFNVFSDDYVGFNRFNPSGAQDPVVLPNAQAQIDFFTTIFQVFDNISFIERRFTISEDGNSIFFQAISDSWTFVPTGAPYNQVYVFRLDFNEAGEVTTIEEYINWVINSEVAFVPLGSCQQVLCQNQ